MQVALNSAGVARLGVLVESGAVDDAPDWTFTDDDAMALLGDPADWDAYGRNFLGIDEDAEPGTRERYLYPFARMIDGQVYVNAAALERIVEESAASGVLEIGEAASAAYGMISEKKKPAASADAGGADSNSPTPPHPPKPGDGRVPQINQQAHQGKLLYRGIHRGKVRELHAGDKVYRSFRIDKREIDVENRMVPLTFSSESPVDRGWCREILDHSPGCVRMGRMTDGAPLLLGHNTDMQIGVVEQAEISVDRMGRSWVRFGRSAKAEEIFQDVLDGIRRHVSVGYRIYDAKEAHLPGGGLELRVIDWEPFENSIVPIGADSNPLVGVNRSFGTELPLDPTVKEERHMDVTTVDREEILKGERERVSQIRALGKQFGQDDFAVRHIEAGTDVGTFRGELLVMMGEARKVTHEEMREETKIGMSQAEIGRYSIFRAIQAHLDKDWSKAGLEREVHNATVAKGNRAYEGIAVAYDVLAAKRDIGVAAGGSTSASGAKLVGTDHLAGSFIEMLRPASVLAGLGMTVLDGLTGNIEIPRRATGATFYVFNNETGTVTESTPTFDNVTASPTTVGAMVDITRRMIKQSSPAVEGLVRQDIILGMGEKFDSIGLTSNALVTGLYGLLYTTGIGSVVGGTDGAAPDWADIVGLETEVNKDNALLGGPAYVFSPKVKGFLKTTEKASGTAQFIMGEGNELNGYPVRTTTQMPDNLTKGSASAICSALLFGNMSDALLFLWGGLDLKVDEVTNGASGGVRLYAMQDMWFAVRHAESFSAMLDAKC
jgi:HK97 family phage major capsid protein